MGMIMTVAMFVVMVVRMGMVVRMSRLIALYPAFSLATTACGTH